jgi:hypothetical protein
MKGFILGVALTLMFLHQAQTPKTAPKVTPTQEAAKPPAIPAVPDANKIEILNATVGAQNLQIQYQGCAAHNWQAEFTNVGKVMQAAIDKAFVDAKVSKDDFDLNAQTIQFTPKPKPAPAPPKPEEKKN